MLRLWDLFYAYGADFQIIYVLEILWPRASDIVELWYDDVFIWDIGILYRGSGDTLSPDAYDILFRVVRPQDRIWCDDLFWIYVCFEFRDEILFKEVIL